MRYYLAPGFLFNFQNANHVAHSFSRVFEGRDGHFPIQKVIDADDGLVFGRLLRACQQFGEDVANSIGCIQTFFEIPKRYF